MKQQSIILIAVAAVAGVVCLGAGWLLYSEASKCREVAEERNQDYNQLLSVYKSKPYPCNENIEQVKADEEAVVEWLAGATNQLQKGAVRVEPQTPAVFKQNLQAKVRDLSSRSGSVKGRMVAADFKFGFDKYLSEDRLPKSDHVERLSGQLAIIDTICNTLCEAGILSLDKVERELFDVDEDAAGGGQDGAAAPRRRRTAARQPTAQVVTEPERSESIYPRQNFKFEFKAEPAAFVEVLNRLAAAELFVVVNSVEFNKVDDLLAKREAIRKSKKEDRGTGEGGALAKGGMSDRIVTDPIIEPPIKVKLDLDVYSFEGA